MFMKEVMDGYQIFVDLFTEKMMFDPQGQDWAVTISQMNFVGAPRTPNVEEWTDYAGLTELGTAALAADVDEYCTLKLACEGDTITVFYDGDEVISVNDSEHKSGTCGQISFADTIF